MVKRCSIYVTSFFIILILFFIIFSLVYLYKKDVILVKKFGINIEVKLNLSLTDKNNNFITYSINNSNIKLNEQADIRVSNGLADTIYLDKYILENNYKSKKDFFYKNGYVYVYNSRNNVHVYVLLDEINGSWNVLIIDITNNKSKLLNLGNCYNTKDNFEKKYINFAKKIEFREDIINIYLSNGIYSLKDMQILTKVDLNLNIIFENYLRKKNKYHYIQQNKLLYNSEKFYFLVHNYLENNSILVMYNINTNSYNEIKNSNLIYNIVLYLDSIYFIEAKLNTLKIMKISSSKSEFKIQEIINLNKYIKEVKLVFDMTNTQYILKDNFCYFNIISKEKNVIKVNIYKINLKTNTLENFFVYKINQNKYNFYGLRLYI